MSKTDDLIEFHDAMDVIVQDVPRFPADDVIELRKSLIEEEYTELMRALDDRDMVNVADGLVDLVVVVIGTAVAFGIPFDACWAEVHRTNMAKRDPETGKVRKRADGKVLKPEGWRPPNFKKILGLDVG